MSKAKRQKSSRRKRAVKNQRKLGRILINPGFQIKYILWSAFMGICLSATSALVFFLYISENYALLVDLSPMTDEAKMLLETELQEIWIILLLASVGFVSLVAIWGLFISHRTAGPLYQFKQVFQSIHGGNTSKRIRLRPNDDFQDVAQSFNEMMDRIENSKTKS